MNEIKDILFINEKPSCAIISILTLVAILATDLNNRGLRFSLSCLFLFILSKVACHRTYEFMYLGPPSQPIAAFTACRGPKEMSHEK